MHVKRVNHNPSNPVSMPSIVIPLLSVLQRAFMALSSNHKASGVTAASRFYISNRYGLTWHVFCLIKGFLVLWSDRRGITLLTRALGAATPQCWRHAEKRREDLCTFPTFHILFLIGVTALCGALGREIETAKEHTRQTKHETWKKIYISNIRLWSLQYFQN